MPRLLPLFPLQLIAFPGTAVPLHIFEERYRLMVGEAEAAGSEFGIVLAKEGGIANAGCTVAVEQVLERYPDGRFDVLTRGRRRFLVIALNEEKPFLQGEVEYFEDDDWTPVTPQLREKANEAWKAIHSAKGQTDADAPPLSFELAQCIDDVDFRFRILRTRSEAERLKHFVEFAAEYVPRQRYTAHMKGLAPTNGAGHRE